MTKREKLTALRNKLGVEERRGRTDEYVFRCVPRCPSVAKGKAKLCVNIGTDRFNCWVCGFKGSSLAQLMLPDDRARYECNGQPTVAAVDERTYALPPEFTPLDGRDPAGEAIYRDYLAKRCVPERSWSLWRLGYASSGPYAGRVIVPSFDSAGVPNFFSARAVMDWVRPKYMLPASRKDVISNEHMVDWGQPIYLVEGAFDQIAVGPQAICLWGTSIMPAQVEVLVRRSPPLVRVCLDSDASRKSVLIARMLLGYGLTISIVTYDGKDPASVGRDAIELAARTAVSMTDRNELCLS